MPRVETAFIIWTGMFCFIFSIFMCVFFLGGWGCFKFLIIENVITCYLITRSNIQFQLERNDGLSNILLFKIVVDKLLVQPLANKFAYKFNEFLKGILLFFCFIGHNLEEIRVRSLENLLSKLEHNLVCDSDLVNERHLMIRLIEWFNFPSPPKQGDVLNLILRLSKVILVKFLSDLVHYHFDQNHQRC